MTTPAQARKYAGKSERDRLAEGEAILRDHTLGLQNSDLMLKYGISRATLYRRLEAAVQARLAPTVDAYREQQNALLDDLMRRWQQQAEAGDAMVQLGLTAEEMGLVDRGMTKRAEALAGMLRVSERRAKLNGLDAPVKAEVAVTVSSPIDDAVARLAAEVEESAR